MTLDFKLNPFIREHSKDRRPFKPKAWTHQDELKALIGKRIVIELASPVSGSNKFYGKLVAADQFTLKVQIGATTTTYFKSALISFAEFV